MSDLVNRLRHLAANSDDYESPKYRAELMGKAADRIESLEFTIAEVRGLDSEGISFGVLHHIETMYPIMLQFAPKTARTSIKNYIIQTINNELNEALS